MHRWLLSATRTGNGSSDRMLVPPDGEYALEAERSKSLESYRNRIEDFRSRGLGARPLSGFRLPRSGARTPSHGSQSLADSVPARLSTTHLQRSAVLLRRSIRPTRRWRKRLQPCVSGGGRHGRSLMSTLNAQVPRAVSAWWLPVWS